MLEMIRNSVATTNERNQINESRAKEILNADRSRPIASNISNNGFSQFINGHTAESATLTAVTSSIRYPSTTNITVRTFASGMASTVATASAVSHPPTVPYLSNASHTPNAPHLPNALGSTAPCPPSAPHPPPAPHPTTAPHPASAPHPPTAPHPPGGPHLPTASHPSTAPHPPSASHPPTAQQPQVRAVTTPSPYLPYQPAVPPPPTRGYYPQAYPSTSSNVPNALQSYSNFPVRGAVNPQIPARPSTSTTATVTAPAPSVQNMQNYNAYVLGRYPPQPPYGPFQ